jgi:FMN reductase
MIETLDVTPRPVEDGRPLIVGIGGTTRPGSSTERSLSQCLERIADLGARTEMLAGGALDLPLYDPHDPHRTEEAARLVELLRAADGVVISSPGYHGGLSGRVKNALDYVEDMRGDDRVYLDGLVVGCLVCAHGWQAAVTTMRQLRDVAHALRAWPTPLGVAINSAVTTWGPDGRVLDAGVAGQIDVLASQVVEFVGLRAVRQSS